ncbi:uncharacterized protein LOC127430014 isoform X1 [Myxocyprinus asiaticus]|uniref:uncharacterized protein LOC127430014 isoform X1 n=1 Tax=Myxocyprinus asiaticus TaxID=70543 RepID=UPI002221B7BD|nr:uncharacterized protein LOC127430014 isoform X1 [Myxocyprinus asiaticus]XP_051535389.1 uncharacterized protein LOC127430014 isoform X1 [Myxocyprinus asiaticus]XP_051535398.1 uncharacterized protein LOC127430014 isoform X1 [Myxocyprinus asiaticus]
MKLLEAAEMRAEPAAKKKVHLTDLPNDLKVWNERKMEHLQRVINQLREENMNLNKENERLKNEILEKIPSLLLATEHLLREPMKSNADVPEMSKTPSHVPLSHAPKPLESNADFLDHNSKIFSDGDMVPKAPSKASLSGSAKCSSDANYVELAHGTGIKILKHQWTSALQTQTATSMVRALLMAAFPLEVLIHSNLKGGMSKTDCGAERSALDKDTMAAIYVAVKKRFPNVSRGALGIAVNSKLGELRLLGKSLIF